VPVQNRHIRGGGGGGESGIGAASIARPAPAAQGRTPLHAAAGFG